jgi:hypothetical protein
MEAGAAELLECARDRVARGWTQHAEARDDAGAPVDPWRPQAVAWSLLGTIVASYDELARRRPEFGLDQLAVALHWLAGHVDDDSLVAWNDAPGREQADVVAALQQAIESGRRGGPLYVISAN